MNKIVREHYPVERLPEDLREGFGSEVDVRVTVEDASAATTGRRAPAADDGHFSQFRHLALRNFTSMAEIDAHLALLRSEWDHRDR